MAKIKIEAVIDRLDYDMKRALERAVKDVIPNATFDRNTLFKAFKKAVRLKCTTWEEVPDDLIELIRKE